MTASLVNSHSLIGHYVILWLDSDINHANECIKTSFNSIEHRIDSIKVLVNIDQFIGFIQNLQKQQIFVIITDSCDQQNIRFINHIEETNQIHSVYLYSNHLSKGKFWQYSSKKFKGIFSQIEQICDLLEQITCPLETHSLSTTIISAVATNPDEYNLSYIYLKLFLEIIYKIEYDDKTRKDAFDYYRRWCVDNRINEDKVDQFEQYYNTDDYPPVWWYSKDIPLYGLLRDALLTLNVDVLIKLGCFLQDLHRSIRKIYLQNNQTENFIVYRGQGMLDEDFEKLRQRKNDLFVFHNFISTTTNEQTGLHFAKNASVNSETKGILFQMNIDPLVGSVLYASLDTVSFYSNAENEILFSTLTVFKIEEINQINDGLWKVNLTLTSQINEIFKFYIDQIRSEIQGKTPWHSLALLFYKMGKYNQAREIFKRIIETTDETSSENFMKIFASMENNIGLMYDSIEDYSSALSWYQRALEFLEKSSPIDHSSLAIVYNNIGMIYRTLGSYSKALSYCEKSLNIRLKHLSSNKILLITSCSNIGKVYESMGDYSTALSYYEKAYEIQKGFYSLYHPFLTLSYNNFAGIDILLGKYSQALAYYEKIFDIQNKYFLSDHPSIANTHNNLGYVYQLMGNYRCAIASYEEARKILQKLSPSNQLSLATIYNNLGLVYRLIGDYSKALSYYQDALKIEEIFLKSDHSSLALTYNNLGAVYQSMEDYSTALTYYEKTLKIWKESLPLNHPSLATIYNNMGTVYHSMGNYTQALSYYEKTLEIQDNLSSSSSSNPLDVASTYNNMGETYRSMKDCSKALFYYQKTLSIEEKYLSKNHPSLAITVTNMAVAYDANKQYEDAFDYVDRALGIFCNAFGSNHAQTKMVKKFLDEIRQKLSTTI